MTNVAGIGVACLLFMSSGLLLWAGFAGEEPPPQTPAATAMPSSSGPGLGDELIVFAAELPGSDPSVRTLFAISSDGSNVQMLTPEGGIEGEPSWSPDGSKIAFTRARVDASGNVVGSDIVVRDNEGLETVLPLGPGFHYSPTWGPDSGSIAYVEGAGQIYTVQVGATDLTPVQAINGGEQIQELMPSWSPDGSSLAYVAIQYDGDSQRDEQTVRIASLDGVPGPSLTPVDLMASEPAWSPDGLSIAFTSEEGPGGVIYLMYGDGTDLRQLTSSDDSFFGPSWSPDGTRLVVAGERDGESGLFVLDIESGAIRLLNDDGGEPAWQPNP